jgi:ATP-binding cassette subfamily F protein uup
VYVRDRRAFTQASEALSTTQAQLAAAEERWLELEMLREEIEGG